MMRLLLTAVVLATPLRATATNATATPTTNATWPEWWPEGRNRVIDARVGRWHILVPPSGTTTIGNKTMWSMCNAAGTPGKHFRDCEKGCNSLGGTLVSVEDQAQQRLLRHFVGEDIDLLIGAYQRTYKSPDSGWRWTSAARPDHSFTAWRRGYPADVGAHLCRNHRGAPSFKIRVDTGMCKMSQCAYINFRGSKRWVDTSCVLSRSYRGVHCATGCVCEHTELGGVPSAHYLAHRKELDNTDFCRPIDIFWITVLVTICGGTLLTFAHSIMKARRRAKQLERMRVRPLPPLAEVTAVSSMPVGVAQSADGVEMPVVQAVAVPCEHYRPCN